MLRRRDERGSRPAAAAEPKQERKPKPAKPRAPRPTELERLEAEIATREAEVADLEQKLAADWSNVETLAAHKSSRDALQALLSRWEQLFEQAST
jgi:hypothetical protein